MITSNVERRVWGKARLRSKAANAFLAQDYVASRNFTGQFVLTLCSSMLSRHLTIGPIILKPSIGHIGICAGHIRAVVTPNLTLKRNTSQYECNTDYQ